MQLIINVKNEYSNIWFNMDIKNQQTQVKVEIRVN